MPVPVLLPTFTLECGWCGGVRTRPLDSTCPLCGGAWFRLAPPPERGPGSPMPQVQALDKVGRHM